MLAVRWETGSWRPRGLQTLRTEFDSLVSRQRGAVTELDNVLGCKPTIGPDPWGFESLPLHQL